MPVAKRLAALSALLLATAAGTLAAHAQAVGTQPPEVEAAQDPTAEADGSAVAVPADGQTAGEAPVQGEPVETAPGSAAEGQPAAGQPTVAAAGAVGSLEGAEAEVAALSPLIGDVQLVGPWTDGARRGIWRTVMLQTVGETAGNRFFVQQIEEMGGTVEVSSSTEIAEVADIDGAVVGYRVDEPSAAQPNQLTLFMDIVPLDGEISETYELFFTPGEPYVFGPASN